MTEGLSGVYDDSDLFLRVIPVGVPEQVCARFTTLGRLRSGRSADLSAAIIDRRNVPTVEAGSEECGDNAAQVHPAHIQDRDGARPLLPALQARSC